MDLPERTSSDLSEPLRTEVVKFLRDFLPRAAMEEYRRMMIADPDGWSRHPHFAGGIILEGALRGNGITEKELGIPDLDSVWPELLRSAVLGSPDAPSEAAGEPDPHQHP